VSTVIRDVTSITVVTFNGERNNEQRMGVTGMLDATLYIHFT